MPLVFALDSGGDMLSTAFGCGEGPCAVLVGHRRMPRSSSDLPVPDSFRITQLAEGHRA